MLALATPAGLALAGCASLGLGGGSNLRVESLETGAYFDPAPVTQVFSSSDPNTAHVLISDMRPEDLRELAAAPAIPEGSILHIHMFLTPRAGQTPIDFQASNCAATLYVFTGDAVGVYGGGGFLLPSDDPGGKRFGGRVAQVTLRPLERGPAFADQLGHSELSGRVSASRDEELTASVLDVLSRIGPAR